LRKEEGEKKLPGTPHSHYPSAGDIDSKYLNRKGKERKEE
jgi:hypothetical protein